MTYMEGTCPESPQAESCAGGAWASDSGGWSLCHPSPVYARSITGVDPPLDRINDSECGRDRPGLGCTKNCVAYNIIVF
jgi:hypothetical protein